MYTAVQKVKKVRARAATETVYYRGKKIYMERKRNFFSLRDWFVPLEESRRRGKDQSWRLIFVSLFNFDFSDVVKTRPDSIFEWHDTKHHFSEIFPRISVLVFSMFSMFFS